MAATVAGSIKKDFPVEELCQAVNQIIRRAQVLFPNSKLKIGEDFHDVESAETSDNNGRIYISEKGKSSLFVRSYIFTVLKDFYRGELVCYVKNPVISEIVKDEMRKVCAQIGVEKLTIEIAE